MFKSIKNAMGTTISAGKSARDNKVINDIISGAKEGAVDTFDFILGLGALATNALCDTVKKGVSEKGESKLDIKYIASILSMTPEERSAVKVALVTEGNKKKIAAFEEALTVIKLAEEANNSK